MRSRPPVSSSFRSEAGGFRFVFVVAAGIAAVTVADLFATTAVLVGVSALAIVGVAGAYLLGGSAGMGVAAALGSRAAHTAPVAFPAVDESALEQAILLALRRSPGSRSRDLAEAIGLPRTNFGRQLKNRLRKPLGRLLAAGVVDEEHGRYQLTEKGRRALSEGISTRSHIEAALVPFWSSSYPHLPVSGLAIVVVSRAGCLHGMRVGR